MSSFRRRFPYYRVNSDGRLTHCAASDAGNLPFHWAEIDPARKPEPTDAQLDSLHCEADLFGEPQIKENIRDALEGFRDIWLSYWALPLPTPFDPSFEAETNLNPLTQSLAKRFANDIVSYPRLLLPSGFVQLGGVQFVGPLRPPKDRPYTARMAPADEANRGAIDLAISLFKEHVRNVGQRCACTCEAIEVMGRFDTLIAWLEDANGFDDSAIANLIDLSNLLDDALHAMSIAVAKTADHASPPPSPLPRDNTHVTYKKSQRDRAKGCSDLEIAAQFHSKCVRLIRKFDKETGRPIYEPRRGTSQYLVGTCCERTVRNWIKHHPTEKMPEPISGFHAGMLTDPIAIENATNRWGKYWAGYARAFTKWREIHVSAPANQFRYKPAKILHFEELN